MFIIYLGIILFILLVRIIYVIILINFTECRLTVNKTVRTLLCVGSGGHTTELLRLVPGLNKTKYCPKLYVMAENDKNSEPKIKNIEDAKTFTIQKIPRSRAVKQSYLSSIFSTIWSIVYCFPLVYNFQPDLVICNGPGTCIPVCLVCFLFRVFFILDVRIVFIESVCRVRTLSLTGYILFYIADIFIIQWQQLKTICPRAKYFGRLC